MQDIEKLLSRLTAIVADSPVDFARLSEVLDDLFQYEQQNRKETLTQEQKETLRLARDLFLRHRIA